MSEKEKWPKYSVFKYVLNVDDVQTIKVEHLVKVLSVEEQRGEIVLYCAVSDTEDYYAHTKELEVLVVGTGHWREQNLGLWRFIGTVKLLEGDLMFHIFWKVKGERFSV